MIELDPDLYGTCCLDTCECLLGRWMGRACQCWTPLVDKPTNAREVRDMLEGKMPHSCSPYTEEQASADVQRLIAGNPDRADQARANGNLRGWFVGQIMRDTHGKANPNALRELLDRELRT
jgi:hypothetical protein